MDEQTRLHIAFVADTWDEAGRNGGTMSARRFVAALREHHRVTVVTAGDRSQAAADHVILPSFYLPGVRKIMRENGFPFAWPKRRVLEEVFQASDVVHIQFPFPLGVRAATLARRLGRPIAAGFHVQAENILYNVGLHSERLAAATYRFFLRTLYNKADEVICPSPFALGELKRYGLRVPAVVISNGITEGFFPAPAERPARHRGRLLVLAVGRLAREKRLDVIIEGVRRSQNARNIQLVVTGRGPRGREVAELGATLPLPAEVSFVSDDELKHLYRTADLLVHASEVELEGMAVLEALGCGLPGLVADAPLSAARQFVASSDFLFRPGDPADLARQLDVLFQHPEKILAARKRCLELRARYSFEESVRQQEALYLRLARRGGATDPPP